MTPRLAVTREQAEAFYVVERGQASRSWSLRRGPVTLRLPERPTMPCPECGGKGWWSRWRDDVGYRSVECNGCARGSVPIPEGTRVRIEWWEPDPDDILNHDGTWHHVTYATLAEVDLVSAIVGPLAGYHITLSDIEPAGEDQ